MKNGDGLAGDRKEIAHTEIGECPGESFADRPQLSSQDALRAIELELHRGGAERPGAAFKEPVCQTRLDVLEGEIVEETD